MPSVEREDGLSKAEESGAPISTEGADPIGHLIVISHGMWGSPRDVAYLAETLKTRLPHSSVYVSKVNTLLNTYHGIDVCGARLVKEIKDFISAHEQDANGLSISKISFVGYSAGGLFNRYAVGLLYREGFFDNVQPICFVTMATPHLGVRELPHTRSQRLRNDFLGGICDFYCGRSGQQMMLVDGRDAGRHPLLLDMSLPGSIFYEGLARFPHIYLYANANRDNTVNYITASLNETNPFRGLKEPPVPADSRWKYVVSETLITEERRGTGVATEEVTVEMTSVYDQAFSPVVLPVLAPLLAVHAVVLMTPLRLLSNLVGDRTPDMYHSPTPPSSSQTGISGGGQPDLPASGDEVIHGGRLGSSSDRVQKQVDSPSSSSTPAAPVPPVDEVPGLIRQHLKTLHIRRVDVFIPAFHTHGTIVVRRAWDSQGAEVIEHLAETVDKHVRVAGVTATTSEG